MEGDAAAVDPRSPAGRARRAAAGEALGEVGEEIGEDFAPSPLGTKDAGQHDPLRCGCHVPHVRASLEYTWNWVGVQFEAGTSLGD